MKKKLRTLKEFGTKSADNSDMGKNYADWELKQEAINDIKDQTEWLKLWKETQRNPLLNVDDKVSYHRGMIDYIKWKFNITKDDLK